MNGIQQRVNTITRLLGADLPLPKKVTESLKAFSGTDITHVPAHHKKSIYHFLHTVNTITARYPFIKTDEDYSLISEADLNKILKNIQRLCLKLLVD
ncbi:MAG: hypothetical protein A3C55_06830 [Gammaproteobacteria bacterium RIFCSPHIGHO2_02_FULL_42_13]|nr:MAG: hypothetical protein A3C55_06830 [Gammaproteobacteria bacterium RIFCSPHIGHO2_02_FULL_42_13]